MASMLPSTSEAVTSELFCPRARAASASSKRRGPISRPSIFEEATDSARSSKRASALVDTEALARLLLRAESVASSKIEGLEIGLRRLLEAEAARALGQKSSDVTASEVLGNIEAMVYAVRSVRSDEELTLEQLLEIHRRLLAGSRLEESGGKIRSAQNWIGGSSYNPCSATFVPPPPELVHDLLLDLCRFCSDDSLPVVVQAALAHAQFETIHPFIDLSLIHI